LPFPVNPLALSQRKSQLEHLADAAAIDAATLDDIQSLAAQLRSEDVVPIFGAGASYDCGVRLANHIGEDLKNEYLADPSFDPHQAVSSNLGEVAEAIAQVKGDLAAVEAIGLDRPDLWPAVSGVSEHYCAYRSLSRLAREGEFGQALGFNYDCNTEAGLLSEGFRRAGGHTSTGHHWEDYVHVVTDAQSSVATGRRGLAYFKAHGCAATFREKLPHEGAVAARRIVLQEKDLTTWHGRPWAEAAFRNLASNHILLLIGFSGGDPTVTGALIETLTEVYQAAPPAGVPRVIVLDHSPNTVPLKRLVKLGLGGGTPAPAMITSIDTSVCSVTCVLTLLLAETLALRLDGALAASGLTLSTDQDARLAELIISLPLMLRWTYLLTAGQSSDFLQRAMLEQSAANGYVPLSNDLSTTVRLLGARRQLRQHLGHPLPETLVEALRHDGFVMGSGIVYLPLDADHDQLRGICGPGGRMNAIRGDLNVPSLDAALVATRGPMTHGVHVRTGAEVEVR
jgi:hypothetical protein